MNIQERFDYYIKFWKDKQTIKIPEHAKKFKRNKLTYYTGPNTPAPDNFPSPLDVLWDKMFWWKHDNLDIPCLTISADGIDNHDLPAIVKVRYIDNPKGGILGRVATHRHWLPVTRQAKTYKGLWKDKSSECIWRGAPTGIGTGQRVKLCHKWHDKFDVGILPGRRNSSCVDPSYHKQSITILKMLNYKYIISVPGNDKDSGLNWKLASNSVVLMSPPKIESWLMEGLLKPYVHYVPLADDYSDLDKIVEWCRDNDDKCQEIAINASNFMEQFENREVERKIFDMVKEHYKTTFTLV
jgi:hypothetical protein